MEKYGVAFIALGEEFCGGQAIDGRVYAKRAAMSYSEDKFRGFFLL